MKKKHRLLTKKCAIWQKKTFLTIFDSKFSKTFYFWTISSFFFTAEFKSFFQIWIITSSSRNIIIIPNHIIDICKPSKTLTEKIKKKLIKFFVFDARRDGNVKKWFSIIVQVVHSEHLNSSKNPQKSLINRQKINFLIHWLCKEKLALWNIEKSARNYINFLYWKI